MSTPDSATSAAIADRLQREWAQAQAIAARMWSAAERLRPDHIRSAHREVGQELIAASLMAVTGLEPGEVSLLHLLGALCSDRAGSGLFRPGSAPRGVSVEFTEWQQIWRQVARRAIGDLWEQIQSVQPLDDWLARESIPVSMTWAAWRLAAYRVIALLVIDALGRDEFAGNPCWDLEGIAREGSRLSLDTAAYRAMIRLREAYGHGRDASWKERHADLVWLRAPEAIGRSRHELTPWPDARQLLTAEIDDVLLAGRDATRLTALLRRTSEQVQPFIRPTSPWHRDHHPIQDDHGTWSLSRFVEQLTDQAAPEWAAAIRRAARWHAFTWPGGAHYPVPYHGLLVTALVVYVLTAHRHHPAADLGSCDVLHAMTTYTPVGRWLATSLGELGHQPGDPADPLAGYYDALVYEAAPHDPYEWSGPILKSAVHYAIRVLQTAADRDDGVR